MDIVSFVMGQKSISGGNASATQHVIRLEFTDTTDTDINLYYDDPLISTMITAYEPSTWTYDEKTVDSASLDGDTWYTRSTGTWETVYNGTQSLNADTPYPYWYITNLASVQITVGSVWRITIDGDEYTATATDTGTQYGVGIGNPLYVGGQDDGSDIPTSFINLNGEAWSGGADLEASFHSLKIERLINE